MELMIAVWVGSGAEGIVEIRVAAGLEEDAQFIF